MNKLYSYNGQIITMSPEDVKSAIETLEKNLRTDQFKYSDSQAFMSQVDEIKQSWPEEIKKFVREKAKEFAGGGADGVPPSAIRKALIATCEQVAKERSTKSGMNMETELRQIASEMAVATLFKRAPEVAITPTSIPAAKKYQEKGRLIRAKPSLNPKRLVVNVAEILSAEIYVLALYVETMKASVLLGFATQKEMMDAKSGNKDTDQENCPWNDKAFYIPLEELRPMSHLYTACGIEEIPSGVAFESVPKGSLLPILQRKEIQDMMKGQSAEEFDFLASVMPSKSSSAAPKSATAKTASAPATKPSPKLGEL